MGICSSQPKTQTKIKETTRSDSHRERSQAKKLSLVLVVKNDKNENEGLASKRSDRQKLSVISNQATIRSNLLLSLDTHKVINERRLFTEDYTLAEKDYMSDSKSDVRIVQHNSTGLLRAVKISKIRDISLKNIQEQIYKYKKLDHPNVLQLYEYFQSQDTSYQVFELCKAQTVAQLIKSGYIFTEEEIIKLISQILYAIVYVNSMGMQHQDLSFDHILYINQDLVKLICFKDLKFKQVEIDLQRCLPGNQENSDIWTIGVLLYELLLGQNPFVSVEIPLPHRITKGLDNDNLKAMENLNEYAQDLLTRMINYEKRPSAAELLKHPFIIKAKKSNTADIPQILKHMTSYQKDSQLQFILQQLMATTLLSQEEIYKLAVDFLIMDKDNDGRISKQDIKYLLHNHEQTDKMFEMFDVDNNGFLDYKEFLVAACDREKLFQKESVQQFYRFLLYPTPSKKLSVNHLMRQFAKNSLTQKDWDMLYREARLEPQQKLGLEEFFELIKIK